MEDQVLHTHLNLAWADTNDHNITPIYMRTKISDLQQTKTWGRHKVNNYIYPHHMTILSHVNIRQKHTYLKKLILEKNLLHNK